MDITEYTRETLKGLPGVVVIVETIRSDAEADGLNIESLQTEVETRLAEGGVKVLPHNEWKSAAGKPWLYISVSTMKYLMSYFFSIDVQLKQDVGLTRHPAIVTSSSTWETGSVGFVSVGEFSAKIHDSVINYVEQFIQDFKAVNEEAAGI
jgi:hypothetical protein